MSPSPVSVDKLPGDDVFPDLIDSNAKALRKSGAKVAARGVRVNAHWKKLSASYGAPETEDLVAKLGPAEKAADRFGHRMGKAASALETFADDARAIKVRAEAIRARANAFLSGVVANGIAHEVVHSSVNDKADTVRKEHLEWYQDDAAVAENKAIFDAIEVLANDLEAAEAKCADAITTAVGAEPVTGPGTSIDWTKVPAGTPTPWGTELSQRSETDAEAQVRGFYERPIAMVNFALAWNGVSNKTLNFDDINNMTFDPTAFDFSLALRGQTQQAVVQSGLGLLVLSSPLLGSLTLANLKSKNWFGSFSRATSGTVIKGGAAYLDQWKTDPQAARGGLVFDALTMFIPGGPEVLLPAKAGARVAEDVAGAGLRTGTTDAARAGAKVEAGAGRNGLPHVPGSGLEARRGLGHAEVRDGVEDPFGAGRKKITADDFRLDRGPAVSEATEPRTPPVHVPERVKAPEPLRVPASAEHHATRVHERTGEPKVVEHEHERVPAKVGATAEHRTPKNEASRATSLPERDLVHAGAPERSLPAERSAAGDGGRPGGSDLPPHAPRPATGEGASAGHDATPDPAHDLARDEAGSRDGEHLHNGGDAGNTTHRHSGKESRSPAVSRGDEDFYATANSRDIAKSHLETDGSLRPASLEGDTTALQHVIGGSPAKDRSPYTSFLTEADGVRAEDFGKDVLELDVRRLQSDIAAGRVHDVSVLTPREIQTAFRKDILEVCPDVDFHRALRQGRPGIPDYVRSLGLSKGQSAKLDRRLTALFNTMRLEEYLIKGRIPSTYLDHRR